MSASHGATPEELDGIGTTLISQIEIVNKIVTDVDSPLNNSSWVGPARDAFQSEWDGNFKTALTKLNEAFDVAGKDCKNRAEGTRMVLGSSGGGGGGGNYV